MKRKTYPQWLIACAGVLLLSLQACKKENNKSPAAPAASDTSQYTTGAHGQTILKSHMHLIEKGYQLAILDGHIYKSEIGTNRLVEDFGEFHPNTHTAATPVNPSVTTSMAKKTTSGATYTNSSGWVAAEEYHYTGTSQINYFTATCTVPYVPITQDAQTFAFWIGLSPASGGSGLTGGTSTIVQPILSYGHDVYTYGGNYYQVFNVFDWGPNGENEAYTAPTTVNTFDNIKFIIQYNGNEIINGVTTFNYSSGLRNASTGATLSTDMGVVYTNVLPNNAGGTIALPQIPLLNYADIVLEDPGGQIVNESYYPNTGPTVPAYVAMTNIGLSTGAPGNYNYTSTLTWNPLSSFNGPQLGESAQVVSANNNNNTTPGQVNLWWAPIPPPPPANAVISILDVAQTTGLLIESSTSSYNDIVPTGNSSFQVPPGTYTFIFNSPGNEYYERFNSVGQVIASNLSDPGQVVTMPNVVLTGGNYSLYIGVYGD